MNEIKIFKVGMKVMYKGNPKAVGTITDFFGSRARVEYGKKGHTFGKVEELSDLDPLPDDTPRGRVGDLIAHWNKPPTEGDVESIRSIVSEAIDGCGLDATAEVMVDTDHDIPTLGHFPFKAVIKVHDAKPAIRTMDGTVVKGMDTITVCFSRKVGLYGYDAACKRQEEEDRLFNELPKEDAMTAIDSLPWDAESVDFSAITNGKAREYRRRHWFPYEGGVEGYGSDHLGGHYGYADTWENLKPDFAAYVRKVANDLGYAGKAWRKEVA